MKLLKTIKIQNLPNFKPSYENWLLKNQGIKSKTIPQYKGDKEKKIKMVYVNSNHFF